MKIVLNDIAASSGGALSILRDFYNYIKLNDTGNEWIFLLSDDYIEETKNIKVIILPQIKKNWVKKLQFDSITGKKFIKNLNPDVVFSLQNIITFGLKVPQIVYIHQSIPYQKVKAFSFFKSNERLFAIYQHLIGQIISFSAKKSNKVVVQTEWMKKAVIKKDKIPEDKIFNVLPSVENLDNYKKANVFNKNSFFYPTSSAVYKNNDCIYEACKILINRGITKYKIKMTTKKEEEIEQVDYIGRIPREQVYDEYNRSTLIFPSYIETFGYPLAEARQMNTPILASDTPFSREVLASYENAYYFDPFRPEQLAELMEKIITGKILRKTDICTVKAQSSWGSVISIIEELALKNK